MKKCTHCGKNVAEDVPYNGIMVLAQNIVRYCSDGIDGYEEDDVLLLAIRESIDSILSLIQGE